MNTDISIQKVSLVFFFVIGIIHIMAHLMLVNGYAINVAYALKSILEIPFILSATIYGLISIKISFANSNKDHKIANIIIILLVIILFAGLVYLNLFIPDRP